MRCLLAGAGLLMLVACGTGTEPPPQITGPGVAPLSPGATHQAALPSSISPHTTPKGALVGADYLLPTSTSAPAQPDASPPATPMPTPKQLSVGAGPSAVPAFVAPARRQPAPPREPAPTRTPRPTSTPRPTHTPRPTPTPRFTSTPRPTSTPAPTHTPRPTSTPRPTATPRPASTARPAPTPGDTATAAPGRFVTSTKSRKYYYCVTDPGWHSLSPLNLVWFPTEADLLASYPNLVLHAPCAP